MFPRVCLYSASQWVPLKMVSILVSARKASVCCGVSLHSALWFRASFPSPVISCLPRRTSRGNASNHLSCKHTAPRLFFLPLLHKEKKTVASVTLSKPADKLHISPRREHPRCKVFIKNDVLFVPLSPSSPRLSLCSSPANALKKFLGTLLSEMCKYVFPPYLSPVRYSSLKCHVPRL